MYGKQPIPHQIPFFSLLPIRHIFKLSYEPKISKKDESCYQLWTIKQVPFFSGKITIFQPTACLPGYCKVPIWANGWFLWPKWVPRHIRTCPRFNFENKNLGSCDEISASRTTVQRHIKWELISKLWMRAFSWHPSNPLNSFFVISTFPAGLCWIFV